MVKKFKLWLNGMTLKTLKKDYYIIRKGIKYHHPIISTEDIEDILKAVNEFSNIYCDEEVLGEYYIVKRKTEKKFNAEEVQAIKIDTGSIREKSLKYKASIGTISKIMNDKY
ncbi:MAG: hypothetical protein ACRC68_17985 [Clostridium sp.]